MIKHTFKKVTAMILTGIMAVNMDTAAFAESETPSIEANMNSRVEEVLAYAKKDLFIHLSMFDIDMENVAVTSVYPLNCLNQEERQAYICFAVKENRIIGEMYIDKLPNGKFTSSFGLYDYPEVEKAITEEKPIAFACDDFSLYLLTDNSIAPIQTDVGAEENLIKPRQAFSNVSLSSMKILPLVDVYNLNDEARAVSDPLYKEKYYPPFVENIHSTEYNEGHGICWAATVASKVMYENPDYKNTTLTADVVFDKTVANNNGKTPNGRYRYIYGLAAYGITANNNSGDQVLSFSELHQKAQNGNLTIFRLKTETATDEDEQTDEKEYTHAVLLAGYQIFSENEGGSYYVMDSSRTTGYKSIKINKSQYLTGKNVVYSGKHMYTWFDSRYTV